MRNILLLILLFLCINNCEAQFQKGQKLIGGQIGFSSGLDGYSAITSDRTYNTTVRLNLSLSKFASPVVANGMGITYQYNYNHSNVDNPTLEQQSYQHTLGLFVSRTRLLPLARKLDIAFTGTGGLNYTFGKLTYLSSSNGATIDVKGITPYIGGSLGVWYQLGRSLLLTCEFSNLVTLNYTYSQSVAHSVGGDVKNTSNRFNFSAGLSGAQLNGLAIGLRFILR